MLVGHVAWVTARPAVAEILSRPSNTTTDGDLGMAIGPGTTVVELLSRSTAPAGRTSPAHRAGTQ